MLQAIGNVLDLPGSMVRDTLALRNPLDQLLSPFSQDNRTSGEQLIEDYTGSQGHSTLGALLAAGLDPMTYMGGAMARGAAKALGLGDKASKAYQASKGAMKTAANALSSADALKATMGAIPSQAKSLGSAALSYIDDATRTGSGARMGLRDYLAAAGNAAQRGGNVAIDTMYGMATPAANTARFAGGLSAALLPAMARADSSQQYDGGMDSQIVDTPNGPVMIPAGARFSLSGVNTSQAPLPPPPWARRYNYSMSGQLQ